MFKNLEVYFYCSYKLSTKGYTLAKVDIENKTITAMTVDNRTLIPKPITKAFSTGGAEVLLGKYNDDSNTKKYYFLVKGIENENKELGRDEMGRNVFINVAFSSDNAEAITKLAQYIILNYVTWSKQMSILVYPFDNKASYEIHYDALKENLSSIEKCEITDYRNEKLDQYLRDMVGFNSLYGFVVISSNRDYFQKMFDASATDVPESVCVKKDDFYNWIKETIKVRGGGSQGSGGSGGSGGSDGTNAKRIEELEKKCKTLSNELDEAHKTIKELKNENLNLKNQIKPGNTKVDDVEMKRKLDDANQTIKKLRAEVLSISEKLRAKYYKILLYCGASAALIILILLIKGCMK